MPVGLGSRLSRWLHWLFGMSLAVKGLLACAETLGGLGLLLTPNLGIISFASWLHGHDLTQGPNADMAIWVRHVADTFPYQVQHFYALYLLAHGALKFAMVIMLARRVLWAYPGAMAVLAGFVIFQTAEYLTHGALVLLALSVFDGLMIILVWREWSVLKRKAGPSPAAEPTQQ